MVKEILYLSSFTSIKLMANAVDVVAIFESRTGKKERNF